MKTQTKTKTKSKVNTSMDDLPQYPFGTGLALDAGAFLGTEALNGLAQMFSAHRGNSDGNMFNLPMEGQIMATGGEVGGDPFINLSTLIAPHFISPFSPTNVLMTEHDDGTVRQWGEPIIPGKTPIPASQTATTPKPMSDKALGYANYFAPGNSNRTTPTPATVHSNTYAMGGEIKIKPSHKGRFTAWAKEHHMSVSEAASHVMSNKSKYNSHVVKMANFAKNFAAMGDSSLQPLNNPQQQVQGQPNIPVEVEGNEVAQLPNGQMGQFSGPSHEQGGIPANLPQGTKIYSDRLSVDGKTMQERKLSRERKVSKLNNMLDKDPTDTINRNTYNRAKNAADMEEQHDLMMQDAASQIYQKVPQLQDASSGFQTPYENQQEQYGQEQDMGAVQPAGVPRQFAIGTGDGGVDDPWNPMVNAGASGVLGDPTAKGYNNPYALTNLPTISFPNVYDNNKATSANTPNTNSPYSTGDKLGFTGNALSTVLPLANTIANRVGDKPNVNTFQNFGKDAIDANDRGMGFMSVVRDEALKNANTLATTQRSRNRNSASSVNTSRALDLATGAQEDTSNNNIYSNYASQMAGMYNERSKLSNQQDLYQDTGAQTAQKEDRMDRDSFYSNLGQNFANVGKQFQDTGKEVNEHDYNNQVVGLLHYLNKYGLGMYYNPQTGQWEQQYQGKTGS